jgi:hypothetical protein
LGDALPDRQSVCIQMRIRIRDHRSQLYDGERLRVLPEAPLTEEYGTAICGNEHGSNQQDW